MRKIADNILAALVVVECSATAGEKIRRPQDVARSRHLVQVGVVFPHCPRLPVVQSAFLVEAGVSSHRVNIVQDLLFRRSNSVVKCLCGKLLVVQWLLLALNEVRHCWIE